jgi:predicted cation transporter
MTIAVGLLFLAVLFGPVLVKPIERHIEIFFLLMGALASGIAGQWSLPLLRSAATTPIALTGAVLVFGIAAKLIRPKVDAAIRSLVGIVAPRWIYFGVIIILGLLSSVITAVISALILVEVIALLKFDRTSEIAAVVLACFAIGLGAALTPIGEPLSAIATSALDADFWYLARLLGPMAIVGIIIVATTSLFLPAKYGYSATAHRHVEHWSEILLRAGKVYLFVAGLVGLSWGIRPLLEDYVRKMPQAALFWANVLSAIVDNATLTAAEIGPGLTPVQQRAALMSLLISGGILIPGNLPNIVAASRLGITSREWARVGIAIGLPLMLLCFAALRWIECPTPSGGFAN